MKNTNSTLFRILLSWVCIFALHFHCSAGNDDRNLPKTFKVKVEEESYLIINGKTNVNSFQCQYRSLPINDILNIDVSLQRNNLFVDDALIGLNIIDFDCGNKIMNKDLHNLLQSEKYPAIIIEIKNIEVDKVSTLENEQLVKVTAKISISGKVKSYELPVTISKNKSKRSYSGKVTINILDFGIIPPKRMMGLVVVDEEIEIEFKLNVSLLNV